MDAVFTCTPCSSLGCSMDDAAVQICRNFWISGFPQQCPEFWALDAALVSKVPASRTERVSPCCSSTRKSITERIADKTRPAWQSGFLLDAEHPSPSLV